MTNDEILAYRRRTQAPTIWEKRHGFNSHQQEGGFSIGLRTRAAPTYDPQRTRNRNRHLPSRDFWIAGGVLATDGRYEHDDR